MTAGLAVFVCSICGEPSTEICSYCTKDTCSNHRCDRCLRCSDCCECEVRLDSKRPAAMAEAAPEVVADEMVVVETIEIMPPMPDPDPPPVREPEPQPLPVHEPEPKPEEPPVPEPTDHKPEEL